MKTAITVLFLLSVALGLSLRHETVGDSHMADQIKAEDWIHVNGGRVRLSWISVSANGNVWAVNPNNYVFAKASVEADKWKAIQGVRLTQVAAGPDGRVWGITKTGSIFTR